MSNCSTGQCDTSQGGGDVSQEDYNKVAEQNQQLKTLLKEFADDRNRSIKKGKSDYFVAFMFFGAIMMGFFSWIYLR